MTPINMPPPDAGGHTAVPENQCPSGLDVGEWKRLLGIDDAVLASLHTAQQLLQRNTGRMADLFRERATAALHDRGEWDVEGLIAHTTQRIPEYVRSLAQGYIDEDYTASRRQIAEEYHIGNEPFALFGALRLSIRDVWADTVLEHAGDPDVPSSLIRDLDRVLSLDLGIFTTYLIERLRRSGLQESNLKVARDTAALVVEEHADLGTALDRVVDAARTSLAAARATIYLIGDDQAVAAAHTTESDPTTRAYLHSAVGRSRERMPVWDLLMESPDTLVAVPDVQRSVLPERVRASLAAGAFVGVRLEQTLDGPADGSRRLLGGMFLSWREPRRFTTEDRLNAQHLASLAALAITRVRMQAEHHKLELELRQSQKLEAIGQLAAGVAHEIHTPIQFVGDNVYFLSTAFDQLQGLLEQYRAVVQTAATGAAIPAEMTAAIIEAEETMDLDRLLDRIPRALSRTATGADRVGEIVKALKAFAHPTQHEQSAADVNQAILTTLTVARNEVKYVADVETDLGEIPPVVCHIGDVNQVILNLVVNAAHAIGDAVEAGAMERGVIRVTTRQEDETVLIEVADNGPGIPPDILQRIWEPFFTTKGVGRGSGQGLAIARSIVMDKHAGTLDVTTEPGTGTTFHVRLPVRGANRKAAS